MYLPTIEFMQAHYQSLLEQARIASLLRQCHTYKASLWERMLWRLGEALISLGYAMKRASHNAAREQPLPIYDMT